MTPEQQRISIAEACGWTHIVSHSEATTGKCPIRKDFRLLPDYLNDLNAMNAAEKLIVGLAAQLQYLHLLSPVHSEWTLATATASERAEAFLKALGLWKEAP